MGSGSGESPRRFASIRFTSDFISLKNQEESASLVEMEGTLPSALACAFSPSTRAFLGELA
jgi:hypothetical protein